LDYSKIPVGVGMGRLQAADFLVLLSPFEPRRCGNGKPQGSHWPATGPRFGWLWAGEQI